MDDEAVKRRRPRALRIALAAVATLFALPLLYFLAALLLGLIPANAQWVEAERGYTIFIRTNGVHTWIVTPKVTPEKDWRPMAPGGHLRDPRWGAGDHVAFGYGNREFYLNTPTWGDLTVGRAFDAAFGGGRTLMHVDHDHDPRPDDTQRRITVSREEYARLVQFIEAGFRRGPHGATVPLVGRGYGPSDMFYEAVGSYDFVLTCNEWTGRALRHAGIRTGLWTPLSQSIMWRLD